MIFINLVKKAINYCIPKQENGILLMPHSGIYLGNKSSLKNYKSDNVLTFANYLLHNSSPSEYIFYLASGNNDKIRLENEICKELFPKQKIISFNYYEQDKLKGWSKILNQIYVYYLFCKSKYFFIASPNCFKFKVKKQKVICLSYYVPFKNDFFEPKKGDIVTLDYHYLAKGIDYHASPSAIVSQINSVATGLKITCFKNIGFCRNDNFFKSIDNKRIRSIFTSKVDYPVNKIVLYTPTHRDYEKSSFDITRSIFGFDICEERFESFLLAKNMIIICKLHPKQNKSIVNKNLPKGVINFLGSDDFGLTELMQVSDMLITDYTSAYFDFLLLNKPVLFNFYDYDLYKEVRGFSYEPLEPFLAGEIFVDEESFYEKMNITLEKDAFSERRKYIVSILNKWGNGACERTYDFFKSIVANEK